MNRKEEAFKYRQVLYKRELTEAEKEKLVYMQTKRHLESWQSCMHHLITCLCQKMFILYLYQKTRFKVPGSLGCPTAPNPKTWNEATSCCTHFWSTRISPLRRICSTASTRLSSDFHWPPRSRFFKVCQSPRPSQEYYAFKWFLYGKSFFKCLKSKYVLDDMRQSLPLHVLNMKEAYRAMRKSEADFFSTYILFLNF